MTNVRTLGMYNKKIMSDENWIMIMIATSE